MIETDIKNCVERWHQYVELCVFESANSHQSYNHIVIGKNE